MDDFGNADTDTDSNAVGMNPFFIFDATSAKMFLNHVGRIMASKLKAQVSTSLQFRAHVCQYVLELAEMLTMLSLGPMLKNRGLARLRCEGFIWHRPPGPHPRIRLALPSGVDVASIRHWFDIDFLIWPCFDAKIDPWGGEGEADLRVGSRELVPNKPLTRPVRYYGGWVSETPSGCWF